MTFELGSSVKASLMPGEDDGVLMSRSPAFEKRTLLGFLVLLVAGLSTIWKFQAEDAQRLSGESSKYRVTVSLDSTSSKSPSEELERILANLKRDETFSIEESELISTASAPVLRYRSLPQQVPKEFEKLNDWQWHYWSATDSGGRWATVHVSLKQLGSKLKASEDRKIVTALAPPKVEGEVNVPR